MIYTDGVTECQNLSGKILGIKKLLRIIAKDKNPPAGLLKNIENKLKEFTGKAPQFDDITLVAFQAL